MIASLLASKLQAIMSSSGVKARGQSCVSSARLPVVYGEALSEDSGAPTIVIYGHYDVPPPDPEDKWRAPPFERTNACG